MIGTIITRLAAGGNSEQEEIRRMENRVQGKVLWYNEVRGYGFLSQNGGEEVFVHQSALPVDNSVPLSAGQEVEFSIVLSPRGVQAADVIQLN